MKITEYSSVTDLDSSNVFLIDGDNGTKTIKGTDLTYALFDGIPEMHKQIWRGKNLGSSFTSEQSNNIKDGSFHDLWLGDYWEIGHNKYRIVDFDYYYHNGTSPSVSVHHVVVMPDSVMKDSSGDIITASFSGSSDLKTTGYRNAQIRTSSGMQTAKTLINNNFGSSHILSYRLFCSISFNKSTVDGMYYASCTWTDADIEIPSMVQIFGAFDTGVARNSIDAIYSQFSLFRMNRKYIASGGVLSDEEPDYSPYTYWTRSVEGSEFVAFQGGAIFDVGGDGASGSVRGDNSLAIRPYFLVS